jgi:hypothetical protein
LNERASKHTVREIKRELVESICKQKVANDMISEKIEKECGFVELELTNHIASLDAMIVDIHKRESLKDRNKANG